MRRLGGPDTDLPTCLVHLASCRDPLDLSFLSSRFRFQNSEIFSISYDSGDTGTGDEVGTVEYSFDWLIDSGAPGDTSILLRPAACTASRPRLLQGGAFRLSVGPHRAWGASAREQSRLAIRKVQGSIPTRWSSTPLVKAGPEVQDGCV